MLSWPVRRNRPVAVGGRGVKKTRIRKAGKPPSAYCCMLLGLLAAISGQ
jgi:hypothetical protein